MSSVAKAIETQYAGCRFRSRLEARWAVFFDNLGIGLGWEYEKEGYQFGDGSRYLPDFWIPSRKLWVEIKGSPHPKEDDIYAAEQLHYATTFPVLMAFGLPMSTPMKLFCTDSSNSGSGVSWWHECEWAATGSFGLKVDVGPSGFSSVFMNSDYSIAHAIGSDCDRQFDEVLEYAAVAAKSARFEFGESGWSQR